MELAMSPGFLRQMPTPNCAGATKWRGPSLTGLAEVEQRNGLAIVQNLEVAAMNIAVHEPADEDL